MPNFQKKKANLQSFEIIEQYRNLSVEIADILMWILVLVFQKSIVNLRSIMLLFALRVKKIKVFVTLVSVLIL